MSKLNQILAAVAVVLFAASVLTYWNSVTRAERFERGQKLLPNLNPDEIAAVAITKGDESVTLERGEGRYTIEEANGYRAKNEAVNRLIRDLLELSLERDVGRSEELQAELEIEPPGEETIDVVLENEAGQEMVHLRVGKRFEGGAGNYVQRLDGAGEHPIYLTEKGVFLSSGKDSYLDKEIIDVASSDIARIEGPDFVFARESDDGSGELELQEIPAGRKVKSAEASRVRNVLSRLSFDEVWVADDPEVGDLAFEQVLRVDLEDQSGYVVSTAEKDERTFLRIAGFHSVERIEIDRDESEEQLQEKADVMRRAEEIGEFNSYHGSWIYELPSSTAEKLALRKADLLEDAT